MLKRFLPRQERFFSLFQQAATQLAEAAQQFCFMLNDLPNAAAHAQTIAQHEQTADKIAHTTFELLHKTFITPFDRNDIHQLTSRLDDILDLINTTAQLISLYKLNVLPPEMLALGGLCKTSAGLTQRLIDQLDSLKHTDEILKRCKEIDNVKNEGDRLLLEGVARLFEVETDCKQLLKVKEIYHNTNCIVDSCHDVANIVRTIVLEYS
jgi:uncharacterized protein Yka (UPF0111/DUF47 family)